MRYHAGPTSYSWSKTEKAGVNGAEILLMGQRAGPRPLPCPGLQAVTNACQQISKAIAERYKEFGLQQLNQPMT